MPSKNGFGNSSIPMTKKVSYGSAMHYKNPLKKEDDEKKGKIIDLSKMNDAQLKAIFDRQTTSSSDSSQAVISQIKKNYYKGGKNSNNSK